MEKQPNRVGWKRGQSDITLHARDGGRATIIERRINYTTKFADPLSYAPARRAIRYWLQCPKYFDGVAYPSMGFSNFEFDWKISFHRKISIKISPDIFRRRESIVIVKVDCRFVFRWNKSGDSISTGCRWDIFETLSKNVVEKFIGWIFEERNNNI